MRESLDGGPQRSPSLLLYIAVQESMWFQTFEDAHRKIQNHTFDICYIDLRLDDSKELKGLELLPGAVKKGIYTDQMMLYTAL
jgi:hypothetical protein